MRDDGFENALTVAALEGAVVEGHDAVNIFLGIGSINLIVVHRGLDAGTEILLGCHRQVAARPAAQGGLGLQEEALAVAEPYGGTAVVEPVFLVHVLGVGLGLCLRRAVGNLAQTDEGRLCAADAAHIVAAHIVLARGPCVGGHAGTIPADEASRVDGVGLLLGITSGADDDLIFLTAGREVAIVVLHVFRQHELAAISDGDHGEYVFAAAIIGTTVFHACILRHGLHVVGIRGHQTILAVEGSLCLFFCPLRVDIGDAEGHTQTERVGKAQPFVPVAAVADVIATETDLLLVVGLNAVDGLFEHAEHGVVDLFLRVVRHVVGLGLAGLDIDLERHVAIGVGIGQCDEGHIDAGGVEEVLVLLGRGVELQCTQQLPVFLAAVFVEATPAQGTPAVLVEIVG